MDFRLILEIVPILWQLSDRRLSFSDGHESHGTPSTVVPLASMGRLADRSAPAPYDDRGGEGPAGASSRRVDPGRFRNFTDPLSWHPRASRCAFSWPSPGLAPHLPR